MLTAMLLRNIKVTFKILLLVFNISRLDFAIIVIAFCIPPRTGVIIKKW